MAQFLITDLYWKDLTTNWKTWETEIAGHHQGQVGRMPSRHRTEMPRALNLRVVLGTAAFILEPNSSQTGRTSQSLLAVMDIAPTILELADVEESAMNSTDSSLLPIRGSSFAALLDNTAQRIHDADEPIALDHAGISVLMQGDWKIVREATATNWHLFNTAEDPSEIHDLALEQPEILAELTGKYEAHAQATGILRRQVVSDTTAN